MKKLTIVSIIFALVVLLALAVATTVLAQGDVSTYCVNGDFIGQRQDEAGEWHHYVTFHPTTQGKDWQVYTWIPTQVKLWGSPNSGYAEAGFQWPFNWPTWGIYGYDFSLCGTRLQPL